MIALLAMIPVGAAQTTPYPAVAAQRYRLPMDSGPTLWTDPATKVPNGWFVRTYVGHASNPLTLVPAGGERVVLVKGMTTGSIIAGGAWKGFRVGIDVPLVLSATGPAIGSSVGLGDVALDGKFTFFETDHLSLGGVGRVSAPTATQNAPTGSEGPVADLIAALTVALGRTQGSINLGQRFQRRVSLGNGEIGDAVLIRASLGQEITHFFGLSADIAGAVHYRSTNAAGRPLEALAGGWVDFSETLTLHVAGGTGLTRGIGAPAWRGMAALSFHPNTRTPTDLDGDGVTDKLDTCRFDAEDVDGYLDDDGCPDPDDDGDGILDVTDPCPRQAEDFDAWQDDDGCPDRKTHVTIGVVQEGEHPIIGASVELKAADGTVYRGPAPLDVDVEPGPYTLKTMAPERATFEVSEDVLPGPRFRRAIAMLGEEKYVTVEIRIVGADGEPLQGRWSWDSGQMLDTGVVSVMAGSYRVELLSEGFVSVELLVEVAEDGSYQVFPADGSFSVETVDAQKDGSFTVELAGGGSFSAVLLKDGTLQLGSFSIELAPDVGEVTVVARDKSTGATVDASVMLRAFSKPQASGQQIELPVGETELVVTASGYRPAKVLTTIVGGESTLVEVALEVPRVKVEYGMLKLSERIFFDTGTARLQKASLGLIDEVALLLRTSPEIERVRVEGHADKRGSSSFNFELSGLRARSVVAALVARGIVPSRLEHIAMGEDVPFSTGADLALNRRVEFHVVKEAE